MKKVSKLALVLVATISFLCFLFYKSRYDKLYNVLEVLEFFGSDKVNEIKSTRFVILKYFMKNKEIIIHNQSFYFSSNSIFHPPSWQHVSNSLYVYSAFCSKLPLSEQLCPLITILALSKNSEELSNLKCQLW